MSSTSVNDSGRATSDNSTGTKNLEGEVENPEEEQKGNEFSSKYIASLILEIATLKHQLETAEAKIGMLVKESDDAAKR